MSSPSRAHLLGRTSASKQWPSQALLLLSLIPSAVSAAVDVSISASPTSQEADSDNPAEYDITVTNTGDDDIKVDVAKRIQELTEARRILLR